VNLQTQIPIPNGGSPIGYQSEVLLLGSCFAENIAEKFNYFQFRYEANPFGILFHPLAIENFLRFAAGRKTFGKSDVFFHAERWHSFHTHSALSDQNRDTLLDSLNRTVHSARERLNASSHVIITFGTAWVYRNLSSNEIVANCHKMPQGEFLKELLPAEAVSGRVRNIIGLIRDVNPSAQIIFTISPVRHIKDGFVENQQSKAHLIAGLHEALAGSDRSVYFPSYEIVMDELRDYRFFAADMIHPNALAIDYIWEKFAAAWIAADAFPVMDEVDAVRKAMAHKPFNPGSDSHQEFLRGLRTKATSLTARYPHMTF
jgi:hypothetical protein